MWTVLCSTLATTMHLSLKTFCGSWRPSARKAGCSTSGRTPQHPPLLSSFQPVTNETGSTGAPLPHFHRVTLECMFCVAPAAPGGNLSEITAHPGTLPFPGCLSPPPLKYVLGLLSKSATCASALVWGSTPGETQPRTGKRGVAVKIPG